MFFVWQDSGYIIIVIKFSCKLLVWRRNVGPFNSSILWVLHCGFLNAYSVFSLYIRKLFHAKCWYSIMVRRAFCFKTDDDREKRLTTVSHTFSAIFSCSLQGFFNWRLISTRAYGMLDSIFLGRALFLYNWC